MCADGRRAGSSAARIVLASANLADYPEGGGHWAAFLQYLPGLLALGHDVHWMEVLFSPDDPATARRYVGTFVRRLDALGFRDRYALVIVPPGADAATGSQPSLASAELVGMSRARIAEILSSADMVWNFVGAVPPSLLRGSRHRVLVDLDPGIYQLSALVHEMALDEHDAFLTVGTNVGRTGCDVPTLGLDWRPFRPFVHLPSWPVAPRAPEDAPFTVLAHWEWGPEFEHRGRTLLACKRAAILRYAALPLLVRRRLELATQIDPDGGLADLQVLESHGWTLAEGGSVAPDLAGYRDYIARSRGELGCAKEVYAALRTGWVSDRTPAYLASGRPVACEDTGFGDHLPVGDGLLTFDSIRDAARALEAIDADYDRHAAAARLLAEEYFSAERCLPEMIEACTAGAASP